eukprot:TRINITY_DN1490_c0_g1_i2.p2 TRINITY_DN1490_c0_g1~~TRINITY_DN1490_c0_g1_i2.p2  ORF type:complete len:100 (-),score=0.31 TRINITY_DN1490_c0_g1_i2:352-651(-)
MLQTALFFFSFLFFSFSGSKKIVNFFRPCVSYFFFFSFCLFFSFFCFCLSHPVEKRRKGEKMSPCTELLRALFFLKLFFLFFFFILLNSGRGKGREKRK